MKRMLLPVLGMLLAAGTTLAQEKGSIRLNAGLIYGSKAGVNSAGSDKGGHGLGIGAEYFISNHIAVAPGFNYFRKSTIAGNNGFGNYQGSVKYNTYDADSRYYLKAGIFDVYGMAGLSIASAKVKRKFEGEHGTFSEEISDIDLGVNVGVGAVYPLSERVGVNSQLEYNTPMQQLALQAGVTIAVL